MKLNLTRARTIAVLLLITTAAIAIQGYHPGLEDDAYYLAAIKRDLNPTLYPHDADFFRLQFQATIYDKLIAASIRLTHLPSDVAIFLWQFVTTLAILAACLAIARRCFPKPEAHWAATATVAALLTIPVSGTGISLTDQYLHPRALATAAILMRNRRDPRPTPPASRTLADRCRHPAHHHGRFRHNPKPLPSLAKLKQRERPNKPAKLT